jgi:hypothetical protein
MWVLAAWRAKKRPYTDGLDQRLLQILGQRGLGTELG